LEKDGVTRNDHATRSSSDVVSAILAGQGKGVIFGNIADSDRLIMQLAEKLCL
jgi:hypothetical protein